MYFYCKSLCILIVVYVFLLFVHVFLTLSMYSYCCLCILIVRPCILIVVYVYLYGPHSSKIVVSFYVLFVLYRSMYCLCVNVYCTTATG